jgi:hypothetical protein
VKRVAVVLGFVTVLLPAVAHAAPGRACGEVYVAGQELRNAGRLLASRERFVRCTQICSGTFLSECRDWLRDVEARIPSIVVQALSPDGNDVPRVRISIDGVRASRPEGGPIELDAGSHRVNVDADGYEPVERDVVAVEGESRKLVSVTLRRLEAPSVSGSPASKPEERRLPETQPDAPPPREARPVPWTVFALGGLAVASAAVWGTFALAGNHVRGDLDAQGCAPHCDPGRVDTFRRDYLIADIALGTAIVAAGAAVVLFLTQPSR